VTTTISSVDAVEMVRKNGYDLIISDLKMPVMDGLQFYDKVREIESDSIFIIITAYGTIPSAVDAVKKGVYDYIPKPLHPTRSGCLCAVPWRRDVSSRRHHSPDADRDRGTPFRASSATAPRSVRYSASCATPPRASPAFW